MQRSIRFAPLSVLLALMLAVLACGGGTSRPTPTAAPASTTSTPPTPTPGSGAIVAGALAVRGTTSYVDSFNYFHVVGEIFNSTEQPLTGIELMVNVADASGQPALDGDDRPMDGGLFSPLLYTLLPGESAPFDFFRILPDRADTDGWQVSVSVANQTPAELQRAVVEVVNSRVAPNDNGTIFLTGELVNRTEAPVKISSFAAALVAEDGRVLAANASSDYLVHLAPAGDAGGGDRTPFALAIDGPPDPGVQAAYYVDAEVAEPRTTAADVTVNVTYRFADEFDDLHLAAAVTNNSGQMLTVRLVAGLYAADGAVLDVASASTPIYVAPGATVPVSLEYFDSLNRSAEAQAQVNRVTVQVDPFWTYPITYAVAELQTANEVKEPVGTAQYSFRGDVVNSSQAELTSATLILAIYDGADNLVASNWIIVYPEAETFKPGETLPFDMSVYLPTDTDLSDYTFTTIVQGYVKE